MENLERFLAEHSFFRGLEKPYLETLTGCATNVRFEPDQFIFREGGSADQFYLVRHGKVAIQIYSPTRGPLTIETLDAGDVLGWSWIVSPYTWHFDAQALELVRAIALDGKCLRMKCENDPKLGFELLRRFSTIIAQRVESTRLQLLDMYGDQG